MAWLLSGRHAGMPVLMIDWDLDAPVLHGLFDSDAAHPGLLELFTACRAQLDGMGNTDAYPDETARQVLAAVDWQRYVERVDADRPLFLLRAGRFDASYSERAARLDWDGLFHACPALFRHFRLQPARVFGQVLIAAGCGRSAAVSVCTSLLPDKMIGLFSPGPRSLDGLCGVLQRAIDYRCSHEDEQRPLLLYPLPCAPASMDGERCQIWRRGAGAGLPGYQATLEALMQACYGRPDLSLESYCDTILLQPPDSPSASPVLPALLDWFDESCFPWQPQCELALLRALGAALAGLGDTRGLPAVAPVPPQFPALRPLSTPVYRHDNAHPAEAACQQAALDAPDQSPDRMTPGRARVFP